MTWGAESQSAVYSAGNGSSRRALREKPANMNKKWALGEHICTWKTYLYLEKTFALREHICTWRMYLYLENIFLLGEHICDRFSFHF